MANQQSNEPASEDRDGTKRPWSDPTLDVIPIADAEGATSGFPITDSVTGVS